MQQNFFEHFGIKLDIEKVKKYLTRDNFAIIDTKARIEKKYRDAIIKSWDNYIKMKDSINIEEFSITFCPPSYKYILENGVLKLSDEFCKKYQEASLYVYDSNIRFFENLNNDDFQYHLNKIVKRYRSCNNVINLKKFKGISGIYLMVLDNYKQIYVGQSKDVCKRIVQHWKNTPRFDKLIFPSIKKSNINIDSFGALDTTRIYIKQIEKLHNLDLEEERIVEKIPQKYLINRIGGGIKLESDFDTFKVINSINQRNLE